MEATTLKISRLIIKNYRNLKDIDVHLSDTVALIGENNSGKSNLLRAVTLPFLADETSFSGKNLSWTDISNDAKMEYYQYVLANQEAIANGTISREEFIKKMPVVTVEVHLKPEKWKAIFLRT